MTPDPTNPLSTNRPDLDPDPDTMRALGYQAVDLAVDWLAKLSAAPVARMPNAEVLAPLVHEPLPRKGVSAEDSMRRFMADYMPLATLVSHPRFFAYNPCPGSYVGALGSFLAASTNLFTGSWLGGAVAAQLEEQVLDWVREAIGLPDGYRGAFTSGGSLANLSALAAARSRIAVDDLGKTVIYVSAETHYSMGKAASILGHADERVRALPVDDQQRIRVDAVVKAITADRAAGLVPMFVCGTFGTTTTGAIDPLTELAAVCRREDLWFHIDGAYGAAVALLPEWRDRTAVFGEADSITLDPHKWLYSPFECGCFLTRHIDALEQAFAAQGEYMQDIPTNEINFFKRGPELSRGNRALKLWMLMRSVGVDTMAEAIRKDLELCGLARDLLAADERVRIVTEPQLSVVCFAVDGGEPANQKLMHDILEDGFLMLSSSRVRGDYVLRFCVLNHRTTDKDIRDSVARILSLI